MGVLLLQRNLLQSILPPWNWFAPFQVQLEILCRFISGFSFLFHRSMCLFCQWQPITSYVVKLNSSYTDPSTFFISLRIILAIIFPLLFHINFRIIMPISIMNLSGILIEICLSIEIELYSYFVESSNPWTLLVLFRQVMIYLNLFFF